MDSSNVTVDQTDSKVINVIKEMFSNKPIGLSHPSVPCADDVYPMNKKPMGIALILNYHKFDDPELGDRDGTERDVDNLKRILTTYGFNVKPYTDLTSDETKIAINDVANANHANYNCLLIVILTHGTKNGRLYTKDDSILLDEIYSKFDANNCKTLIGKPKIFLVQACRGTMADVGALYETTEQATGPSETSLHSRTEVCKTTRYVIPTTADFITYFSSAEGYPSFSNKDGSWFVQAICTAFQACYERKEDIDIIKLFTGINRAIAYSKQAITDDEYDGCKQMPVIVSQLTKCLVFKSIKD